MPGLVEADRRVQSSGQLSIPEPGHGSSCHSYHLHILFSGVVAW
jgi:hypothetical protein